MRAETFYYEILPWLKAGAYKSNRPKPSYLDKKSLKENYLKSPRFITDADLRSLKPSEDRIIGRIYTFLYWRLRDLIKQRGVGNAYISRVKHPQAFIFKTKPPGLGTKLKIPSPRKKFIHKIKERVYGPPF
ncbi:MAG: hypothetical protein ACYTKD_27515 [Planctomycetota bacterium]